MPHLNHQKAEAALLWLYAFYLYLDEHVFQKALAVPETTPESAPSFAAS